jgi:N-acetyl-gamma-glutamyl-phosphate reductase
MKLKVSIVGATAYTSLELIKILLRHPQVEIVHLGGRREGSPGISEVFPALRGRCEMALSGLEPNDAPARPDVAFFTLPHQVSMQYIPRYLKAGIKCIDFGADYRFSDLTVYRKHYGEHGDPENQKRAVYGIPELFRDRIRGAELIANPGCYPTAALLAVAPLVVKSLADASDVIVDAKSGVSGRGNKPEPASMYCECNENVLAYNVGKHRHEPEIEQGLKLLGAGAARVLFVPHLVPMDRGILSTIYMRLTPEASAEELYEVCRQFYAGMPFIRVLPPGQQPRTKDVSFTNYCDIAVTPVKGGRVVVTSAIDNLMRGAASQAVQNMNVAFDLPEGLGLL